MSGAEYRPDRRVDAVPKVNRVKIADVTMKDELRVQKKFSEAMGRAADALREEREREQKVSKRRFADALATPKKR